MIKKRYKWIFILSLFFLATVSGCLPSSYHGGENRFGDKWEAVVERDAHAKTLFSRLDYLKQLSGKEQEQKYQHILRRLNSQPEMFWRLEAVYLAILTGHTEQGTRLIYELQQEVEMPVHKDDFELKGVVGLLDLLLKQKGDIAFLSKSLEEEKEKTGRLAHQLNELKNIEKIIHEREINKANK